MTALSGNHFRLQPFRDIAYEILITSVHSGGRFDYLALGADRRR